MSINEVFIQSLESRIRELTAANKALVAAVEQYVEPKPGTPYLHRSALLKAKNDVKNILK